jgi:hypothetical protein
MASLALRLEPKAIGLDLDATRRQGINNGLNTATPAAPCPRFI